jgi:hypothetical protein
MQQDVNPPTGVNCHEAHFLLIEDLQDLRFSTPFAVLSFVKGMWSHLVKEQDYSARLNV